MIKRPAALLLTAFLAVLTTAATTGAAQAVTWPRTWILASSTLTNIKSDDSAVAQAAFDNHGTYIEDSYTAADPVPTGWSSVPTVDFKSFLDFRDVHGLQWVLNHDALPSWAGAILYDPEAGTDWPTNPQEQVAPCTYMQDAATALATFNQNHGLNLPLILTPATDLGDAVSHPGETDQQWFLSAGIAGCAGETGAKIVTVQAQANEFDPTSASTCAGNTDQGSYQYYVCNAAAQVHQTPNATVTSGLAAPKVTSTGTRVASATDLYDAAETVPSYSAGFFFYVSSASPNPHNAVAFLQLLGY